MRVCVVCVWGVGWGVCVWGGVGGWGWGEGGVCYTLFHCGSNTQDKLLFSFRRLFIVYLLCGCYYGKGTFQYRAKLTSIIQEPDISIVIGRLRFFSSSRKSAFQICVRYVEVAANGQREVIA